METIYVLRVIIKVLNYLNGQTGTEQDKMDFISYFVYSCNRQPYQLE